MDYDGFKLVRNKRRKNTHQFGSKNFLNRININNFEINSKLRNCLHIGALNIERIEKLNEQIDKCLKEIECYIAEFEKALKQIYAENIQSNGSNESLESIEFESIICFGLGSFTQQPSSLYQLALLIHLQKYSKLIRAENFQIYDPNFSDLELQFLQTFQLQILSDNNDCRFSCQENRATSFHKTKPILFYMPHMYHHHYFNLIDYNLLNLDRIILFGNSLKAYNEMLDSSDDLKQLQNLLSNIKFAEIAVKSNSFRFDDVFFQQSFHCFHQNQIESDLKQKKL